MAEEVGRVEEKTEGNGRGEETTKEDRREEDRIATLSPEFEDVFEKEMEELKTNIRVAVQEAVADTLAKILEEKEEEEVKKEEIETEEQPKCPKNLSWLRKMFEILPLEILKESKLWRYRKCVIAVSEAEKDAGESLKD